jgi:hypothetical protein
MYQNLVGSARGVGHRTAHAKAAAENRPFCVAAQSGDLLGCIEVSRVASDCSLVGTVPLFVFNLKP